MISTKKILLICLLPLTALLFAEESLEAITDINWEKSAINVNITIDLPSEINVLPEAKIQAESEIEDALPIIIQKAMENVILNSTMTVLDRFKKDLHLTSLIDEFSDKKYKIKTSLTKDLLKLKTQYQIPLYPDFCSAFIEHSEQKPLKKILYYVPSQKYSGIVIYAAKELPLFGKNQKGILKPSLFPKILNEKGEVIFTPLNMNPKKLKEKGAVTFVNHLDKTPKQLVGLIPLNIKAEAIYGKNQTDLVIPSWLADKILAKKANQKLLKEGKIVIICKKDALVTRTYFKK